MKTNSAKKATPFGIILLAVAWILIGSACSNTPPAPQTVAATSAPASHHSQAYNDLMTWKTDGGYAALQVLGADLNQIHNPASLTPHQYHDLMTAIEAAKNYPLPESVDPGNDYVHALRQFDRGMVSLHRGDILDGVSQLELGTATMLDVKSHIEKIKAHG